jgi:hypothetical protein
LARATHLVKRFFGSLLPLGPSADDAAWAESELTPAELDLWRQLPRTDRRHAAKVARRVEAALGDEATRPVLAAALMHDVGKLDAGLGVYGRVVATVSGEVVRHDEEVIRDWTRVLAAPSAGRRHARVVGKRPVDRFLDSPTPPAG